MSASSPPPGARAAGKGSSGPPTLLSHYSLPMAAAAEREAGSSEVAAAAAPAALLPPSDLVAHAAELGGKIDIPSHIFAAVPQLKTMDSSPHLQQAAFLLGTFNGDAREYEDFEDKLLQALDIPSRNRVNHRAEEIRAYLSCGLPPLELLVDDDVDGAHERAAPSAATVASPPTLRHISVARPDNLPQPVGTHSSEPSPPADAPMRCAAAEDDDDDSRVSGSSGAAGAPTALAAARTTVSTNVQERSPELLPARGPAVPSAHTPPAATPLASGSGAAASGSALAAAAAGAPAAAGSSMAGPSPEERIICCFAHNFGAEFCSKKFMPEIYHSSPQVFPSQLHFEDKFCPDCKANGLDFPASQCRILPKKMDPLRPHKMDKNDENTKLVGRINRRNGKGESSYFLPVSDPLGMKLLGGTKEVPIHAAIVNNREGMKGDFLVIYREDAPPECKLNPPGPEFINHQGKVHLVHKYGGLCFERTDSQKRARASYGQGGAGVTKKPKKDSATNGDDPTTAERSRAEEEAILSLAGLFGAAQ